LVHPRASTPSETAPTVRLDNGIFVGTNNHTVSQFLGIPFAQPPSGRNRLRLPVAAKPYTGQHNATAFGLACPQQGSTSRPTSEDCLFLDVVQPLGTKAGARLPVVAWIYGGGFEDGATSEFDGGIIVNRSIAINQPIIYVAMNYRVASWGFLGSQEVKDAGVGNLGLEDQRLALRWIQKYIAKFGGDPDRVTIWGESAGAISVALQMVTNGGDTEGLFRGAFMQSGAPIPVADIAELQPFFDQMVNSTGCTNSSDKLECLRGVSEEQFQAATDLVPSISSMMSLNLAFIPRVDGRFLKDDPQKLVLEGSVAKVPFVNGNNDDEGTLFTEQLLDIVTDEQFLDYIHQNYLPNANQSVINTVAQLYPSDPAAGSPFDTGDANAVTPEFKRLAAFQGDLVFQGPRRFFINERSSKQPIWAFLNKRLKATPALGSFHGSDLEQTILAHAELQDYLINFINSLDPNVGSGSKGEVSEKLLHWPQFSNKSKQLLTILDGPVPLNITTDDYRKEALDFLMALVLEQPE